MSWKRKEIPGHKFDFVDEKEFVDHSIGSRLSYFGVFVFTIRDIMIYVADLLSITILVSTNYQVFLNTGGKNNGNFTFSADPDQNTALTQNEIIKSIGVKLLFGLIIGSLLVSFLLLFLEWRKGLKIIESRDISYSFTSTVAYRYYTIRSYAMYCFFEQIQNSRKTVDILAFFVFFKFKGWKRLLFAEFPRQFLNAIILQSVFSEKKGAFFNNIYNTFADTKLLNQSKIIFGLQLFTTFAWLVNFTTLFIAFCIYVPLVTGSIRGNLKEYCVHKIDKRIAELLKRKKKERVRNAKEEISSSRAPKLPSVNVDLDSTIPRRPITPNTSTVGSRPIVKGYPTNNSYGSSFVSQADPRYQPSHRSRSDYDSNSDSGSYHGSNADDYYQNQANTHYYDSHSSPNYGYQSSNASYSPYPSQMQMGGRYNQPRPSIAGSDVERRPGYSKPNVQTNYQYRKPAYQDVNNVPRDDSYSQASAYSRGPRPPQQPYQ